MILIADYLRMGYRGIVFLDADEWRDAKSALNHKVQKLACFDKDGRTLQLSIHWIWSERDSNKSHLVESLQRLSQAEYDLLVNSYGAQDDALYHQRQALAEKQRRDAENALGKMTPICPLCNVPMTLRKDKSEKFYWECSVRSRGGCHNKQEIDKSDLARYLRLVELAKINELPQARPSM